MNNLPNLLIFGAMKAGTTSLHDYLSKHPDVYMSVPKELDFFCPNINYSKGIEWYKNHFKKEAIIRGESSPNYSKWDNSAKLIKKHLGNDVKLIYITRNPLKRYLSQCNHMQKDPNALIKTGDFINNEYFTNGLYYKRLSAYSKCFDLSENLCIIKLEDLEKDSDSVLKKIFNFLGVDENKFQWNTDLGKQHITAKKELASEMSIKLAKSNIFIYFKKIIYFLPFAKYAKKLYHLCLYKKRKLYKLSDESKKILSELYKEDLKKLKNTYKINYLNE